MQGTAAQGATNHKNCCDYFNNTESQILKHVMVSATEAELGSLFITGQKAVPIRTTLAEMNYPQPPTPIQFDNSTAVVIANKTVR